ncbi:aspartyl/asparaginyl beta-hydroxylase domain-containing protein [Actinomadura harenae]|uniref:Aspartyl/asparaginyl beta-hydroxylase domain-containing protein n=1 Tax=Actinomadura harenae TaxID=2483351 RepID=A0A3M2M2K4_9ACTN|nr:aspartyl/asparaginyl beta-hydroxylase domain-containing protein [Actinomadura harenae]RMI43632.1 aspartyl/asparaginyl beta-hydroxylase domain-containing protein [Actinomadura harenae]
MTATTVPGGTRAAPVPTAVPLDRAYDADRLAAEVEALRALTWRAQRSYGQEGQRGTAEIDWRILPLRSPGGDPARTDPGGAGLVPHADTPYLERTPYIAELLAGVPAPLRAVRLMALGPGVRCHEHRDGKCGYPWGAMRLHVPVVTNPDAVVVIGGEERHWDAGRLWFGDFDRPHHVRNGGDAPRVHLVIDVGLTPELLALFPAAFRDRLPWRDVLYTRSPKPLGPADLTALTCAFDMPAAFPDWSEDDDGTPRPDVPGSVRAVDGRLCLCGGDGAPLFALVHVGSGEFRFEGWTEERTLRLDLDSGTPCARYRVRCGTSVTEAVRPARPLQDHPTEKGAR